MVLKTEPETLLLVLRINADLKADETGFKGLKKKQTNQKVVDICEMQFIW